MHHHLLVHPEDVYKARYDMGISAARRERAAEVADTIDALLEERPDEVLRIPKETHPQKIPPDIQPGDSVTLYGAYLGTCLAGTQIKLTLQGVSNAFHPYGCL